MQENVGGTNGVDYGDRTVASAQQAYASITLGYLSTKIQTATHCCAAKARAAFFERIQKTTAHRATPWNSSLMGNIETFFLFSK